MENIPSNQDAKYIKLVIEVEQLYIIRYNVYMSDKDGFENTIFDEGYTHDLLPTNKNTMTTPRDLLKLLSASPQFELMKSRISKIRELPDERTKGIRSTAHEEATDILQSLYISTGKLPQGVPQKQIPEYINSLADIWRQFGYNENLDYIKRRVENNDRITK